MFEATNAWDSINTEEGQNVASSAIRHRLFSSPPSRQFSSLPRRFCSAMKCTEIDEERRWANVKNEDKKLRRVIPQAKSLSRLNTLNYDNAALELESFQNIGLDNYPQLSKSSGAISLEMDNLENNDAEGGRVTTPKETSLSDLSWHGSLDGESMHSSPASECSDDGDDATRVLNELDMILDMHGAVQLTATTTTNNSLETKVEDCLLDLDNYLEEMDDYTFNNNDNEEDMKSMEIEVERSPSPKRLLTRQRNRPLPLSRKKSVPLIAEKEEGLEEMYAKKGRFEPGQPIRRTITCINEKKYEDLMEQLERTPLDGTRQSSEEAFTELFITEEDAASATAVHTRADSAPSESLRQSNRTSQFEDSDDTNSPANHSISTQIDESPQRWTTDPLPTRPELRRCYSQNRLSNTSTNSRTEMLTQEDIFNNLLLQNDNNFNSSTLVNRPRQFGRRATGHPPVLSVRPDILEGNHSFGVMSNSNQRPQSAPAISAVACQTRSSVHTAERTERHSRFSAGSDASSGHTSRNSSPITVVSSTDSASTTASTNGHGAAMTLVTNGNHHFNHQASAAEHNNTTVHGTSNTQPHRSDNEWPHVCSRALALVCCTVGLFNVSRFAVLTIEYGGNFVLQFFLLSLLFGIPIFLLHVCLGSRIKAGPISMWKISPICRGIGIALVLVQFLIAIYSTVAVAWLLIYLRDAIPNKGQTAYLWQEMISPYRRPTNNSANLTESVSDYFNIVVLQRLHLLKSPNGGPVRFRVSNRLTFNLAIIWAAVFLIMCRGLKSFGKAVFLLTILPLIALAALICKLLYVVNPDKLQNIFTGTDFGDFFENSKMWVAAAQEVFLTWGLLGSSVISITSCTHMAGRNEISLRRDAIFAILITLFSILVAALLGMLCVQIINQHSYIYMPGSFETLESSKSVFSPESIANVNIRSLAYKWMPHYSSFIGEIYRRQTSSTSQESGFQALRFISEILPATLILARNSVSWVWAMVALSAFLILGLSQLCVMWKPIARALGNSTSAVLLSCVTGLLLGVPFTTEIGISILYYMDLVFGGSWFVAILWTAQIFGVFLIRGRPYNGDDLVNCLKISNTLSAFTALAWNVLLPIGLITLSVVSYKTSFSNQFYYWRGTSYFTYWARKVAAGVQIGFLLLIPITAIVQIYRYLTKGPPDILDRIQLLYRPGDGLREIRNSTSCDRSRTEFSRSETNGAVGNLELNPYQAHEDAPPKYTPPPSYTTATGARLAKILRQSIRRSVRRVLGDRGRPRPILTIESSESNQPTTSLTTHHGMDVPQYTIADMAITNTALITTTNQQREQRHNNNFAGNSAGEHLQRSLSLGRKLTSKRSANAEGAGHRSLRAPYTADDVVTVLRSTANAGEQQRPETVAIVSSPSTPDACELSSQNYASFRSIENLVTNAAPMARSAAFTGMSREVRDNDITNESGSNL